MEIMVPFPPSVNQQWRTFNGRLILSEVGRKYRKTIAGFICHVGPPTKKDLTVIIEAFAPDNRRRDLDNLLKASLDALTHAGIWLDDSQIKDLRIFWAKEKGGYLKIKIEEMT